MYTAPIAALTGELFGKNKWSIVAGTVLPALVWFVLKAYLGSLPNVHDGGTPLSFVILLGAALQLACIFAYVDLTANSKSAGFPKHILLLPLPTWLLALVPIVAGSLFISGFVVLWLRYVSGVHFTWAEQLIIAAAIASLMCWIQAMSWELVSSRALRIVVLTVAAIVAVLSVVSLVAKDSINLFGKTDGAVGLAVTAAGGLGLAYLAVIRSRRGDAMELGVYLRSLWFASGPSSRNPRLPALTNGIAAQDWYEWRVYGRLLPTCMMILAVGPLVATLFARIRSSPSFVLPSLVLFLFLLIAPLAGIAYVSKNLTRRVQMGLFDATRPLSDLQLAFAKLRLALRSYLAGLAFVLAVVAVIVLTSHNNAVLLGLWSRLTAWQGTLGSYLSVFLLLVLSASTSWAMSAWFMSLQLFGECVDRKKHGWKISVATMAVFLELLRLGHSTYESRTSLLGWLDSMHWQVLTPLLVLAGIGAGLLPWFLKTHKAGPLLRAAAGVGIGTGLCLLAVWQLQLSFAYRMALSSLVVSVALLAFIPCLMVPILMNLNRHR